MNHFKRPSALTPVDIISRVRATLSDIAPLTVVAVARVSADARAGTAALLTAALLMVPTSPARAAGDVAAAEPQRAAAQDDASTSRTRIARQAGACTTCHGAEGRATPSGFFPRIAGKPAGYLYEQLLNFRDGRRQQVQMQALLENLSDRYLLEFAEYFGSLKLPYPPPESGATADPAVLARGERLVREGDPARQLPSCASCHGEQLSGIEPGVPGLLGLSRDYLNAQLGAWRIGQRRAPAPDCMAEIAHRLQPEEVSALTTWLSRQPVPSGYAPQQPAPDRRYPLACSALAH